MRYSKFPAPTLLDFLCVLFAVLTANEKTIDPISLGYGALGGDSLLGPLRGYLEARDAGVLYVDNTFQIRLSDTPTAELVVWLCVFNCRSILDNPTA